MVGIFGKTSEFEQPDFAIDSEESAKRSERAANSAKLAKSDVVTINSSIEETAKSIYESERNIKTIAQNITNIANDTADSTKEAKNYLQESELLASEIGDAKEENQKISNEAKGYKDLVVSKTNNSQSIVNSANEIKNDVAKLYKNIESEANRATSEASKASNAVLEAKSYADAAGSHVAGVTSFNGRQGGVVPMEGDYTPDMVGAMSKDAPVDYYQLENRPSLSKVATTGSYNDLTDVPTDFSSATLDEKITGDKNFVYPFDSNRSGFRFGNEVRAFYDSFDKKISVRANNGVGFGFELGADGHLESYSSLSSNPIDVFTELNPPTADQVGARPNNWMPTAKDIGALGVNDTAVNAAKLKGYPPSTNADPATVVVRNRNGLVEAKGFTMDMSSPASIDPGALVLYRDGNDGEVKGVTINELASNVTESKNAGSVPINGFLALNETDDTVTYPDGSVWLKSGSYQLNTKEFPSFKTKQQPFNRKITPSGDDSGVRLHIMIRDLSSRYFIAWTDKGYAYFFRKEFDRFIRQSKFDIAMPDASAVILHATIYERSWYVLLSAVDAGKKKYYIEYSKDFVYTTYIEILTENPVNAIDGFTYASGKFLFVIGYELYEIDVINDGSPQSLRKIARFLDLNRRRISSMEYFEGILYCVHEGKLKAADISSASLSNPITFFAESKIDTLPTDYVDILISNKMLYFLDVINSEFSLVEYSGLGFLELDIPEYKEAMPNIPFYVRGK